MTELDAVRNRLASARGEHYWRTLEEVADSAAFTTGPEKNPVLTAMALAARGTQRLLDDMRAGAI